MDSGPPLRGVPECPKMFRTLLQLNLALQLFPVLQAVVARQPGDELEPDPFVQDARDVLARDPGHCGDIALADLLADQNASVADRLAERLGKIEQGARDAPFQRQKASSREN